MRAASDRVVVREHGAWATQLHLLHDQTWAIHLSDGSTVTESALPLASTS
jgi:hypothetical protein